MTKLMPLVYTKLAKLQGKALWMCLLSAYVCKGDDLELTTRSDEAIIYWFFEAYFENDWKHNIEMDLAKMNNPDCKPEANRTKRQGCPHASKNMVEKYYDWRNKIALKRSDKSKEALSWNLAVRNYAQKKYEEQLAHTKQNRVQYEENREAAAEGTRDPGIVPGTNGMSWSKFDFIMPASAVRGAVSI
jgi:hypothetical protein